MASSTPTYDSASMTGKNQLLLPDLEEKYLIWIDDFFLHNNYSLFNNKKSTPLKKKNQTQS